MASHLTQRTGQGSYCAGSATASPPPRPFPTSVSGSWVPDSVPPCTPVSRVPVPAVPPAQTAAAPGTLLLAPHFLQVCSNAPLRFSLPACSQTRYPFTTSCPTHAVTFSAKPQLPGGAMGRAGICVLFSAVSQSEAHACTGISVCG